jgi:hypothetical protein
MVGSKDIIPLVEPENLVAMEAALIHSLRIILQHDLPEAWTACLHGHIPQAILR